MSPVAATDLGAVTLGDHQFTTVNFAPKDAANNPVKATITGTASDPAALDVVVAADGLSAKISSKGHLGGPLVVTFSGSNPDGTKIEDVTVEVTVVSEAAKSLNATLGTPAEQVP